MRRRENLKFDRPYLLLCEGESDKKVFDRIIERYVTGDQWQVVFAGGRSGFGDELIAYEASPTFVKNVRGVLIVSDKDVDPDQSFREVQSEISKTSFPVPMQPSTAYKKTGLPDVAVLLVPIRSNGNLETLCLLSARDNWGFEKSVNDLINNTHVKNWNIGKISKAKMEIYLAITCEKSPDTSFAGHWNLPSKYHLPVDHYCFLEYASFLNNFGRLLETAVSLLPRGPRQARRD